MIILKILSSSPGNLIRVERNSNIGVAICLVAEILEKLSSTCGMTWYMVFFISRAQAVRATMQTRLHSRERRPT